MSSSGPDSAAHFVSFSGQLEDIGAVDLFRRVAQKRLTGRLSIQRRGAEAVIYVIDGRFVQAASTAVRETLGSLVICRGLAEENDLLEALRRQQAAPSRRLGEILLEMGKVTREQLDELIHLQISKVIAEVLQWDSGFFKFRRADGEQPEIADEVGAAQGLAVESLLGEAATRLEEPPPPPPLASDPQPDFDLVFPETEAAGTSEAEIEALLGPLTESPAPVLRGENLAMLMRCASHTMRRGVLFNAGQRTFSVVAHFGFHDAALAQRLRSVDVPAQGAAILREAAEHRRTYRGPVDLAQNPALLKHLGGVAPVEALVLPMVVNGVVALVFYGDRVDKDPPMASTRPLEFLVVETGMEMEKADVEQRMGRLRLARRL